VRGVGRSSSAGPDLLPRPLSQTQRAERRRHQQQHRTAPIVVAQTMVDSDRARVDGPARSVAA